MKVLDRTASKRSATELLDVLRGNREQVGDAFAVGFEVFDRWRDLAQASADSRADHLQTHFNVFADYLIEYFHRGDETFKHLLVGESIKALYEPTIDEGTKKLLTEQALARQVQLLEARLRPRLSPQAWSELEALLGDVRNTLTAAAPVTQRVLLVGDCIFLDIVSFAVAELLAGGIRLVPHYITSKNPVELRDQLRKASDQKFDAVFFSPFSYEFSPEYAQLAEWRRSMLGEASVRAVVDATWKQTRETIDLVASLFDCPIHVHNSAAIVRDESYAKRAVKVKATFKVRSMARTLMNQMLADHLQASNAASFKHLFLFDELRLVGDVGELEAGAYFYKTPLQHPALLGRILAREYVDILHVNAWLQKKKVVVCDLDNTLWDGVIGEGAVQHFHDRQKTLHALKAKGVVLAINSKNDPANVHWRGGTLQEADFVCSAISWDPKVQGMKRIQASLNLKMKDYVFVDDREDERELMRMTYPEIVCVDATSPSTWRRFALWAELLEDDLEMDRTLMYRQREERKAFIKEDVSSEEERAALFNSLDLKLTISNAKSADLKRFAELINRTNQFNLEGSRTSFKEVSDWHASKDHLLLVGQTADRFGDMGITCVCAVQFAGDTMRLLPFVLSCRVFGYGIEHGIMAHLQHVARQRGIKHILGRYVATPQNAPCANFLAESGFIERDGTWVLTISESASRVPKWLQVVAD